MELITFVLKYVFSYLRIITSFFFTSLLIILICYFSLIATNYFLKPGLQCYISVIPHVHFPLRAFKKPSHLFFFFNFFFQFFFLIFFFNFFFLKGFFFFAFFFFFSIFFFIFFFQFFFSIFFSRRVYCCWHTFSFFQLRRLRKFSTRMCKSIIH